MEKKVGIALIFGIFFVLVLANPAFAAINLTLSNNPDNGDNVARAYACLQNQTSGKNLSLKEATFSLLAIGGQDIFNKVESYRDLSSCWPKGACTLKETAQSLLAYNRVGQETSNIKKWILSKNITASELKWLLEIDITNKVASTCTINDGQRKNTINILENSKIQGNPGPCFSIDNEGYMLKVNQNCLRNEFEISCDQDFVTSVLYQRNSGGTLFILPEAHSAASLGSTKERINGECFGTSKSCDYEGTLWATLALQKAGVDVSRFAPYLLALADDNTRFFPSAFLYVLVGGDDQYNSIIQQQKQGKFWEMAGTRDGRYYDTSLAMLSLADKGGAEIDATKSYLFDIQTKEGCWNNNNIRDSAFLLYSGWSKSVGGIAGGSVVDCEPTFSCENSFLCTQSNGTIEYDYSCQTAGQSCCSVNLKELSCDQKNGLLCPSDTQCNGRVESSSDGPCCLEGSCTPVQAYEDSCTPAGGICRNSCDSGEEISSESCSLQNEICCINEKSSLGFWIVTLIILIILAALGIIFRHKVLVWWYKLSEKFKKKPIMQQKPMPIRPGQQIGPYPRQMMAKLMPQQVQPKMQMRPIKPVAKDKELEEALKKLREMSGRNKKE